MDQRQVPHPEGPVARSGVGAMGLGGVRARHAESETVAAGDPARARAQGAQWGPEAGRRLGLLQTGPELAGADPEGVPRDLAGCPDPVHLARRLGGAEPLEHLLG